MSDIVLYGSNEDEDTRLNLIKEGKPRPIKGAFRWVMVGASASGKSMLIKNILFNKEWGYTDYFHEHYLFSGSMDDVIDMKKLRKQHGMDSKMLICQVYDDAAVKTLIQDIEESAEKQKNPPKVLMVFDDQLSNNLCSSTKRNAVDELQMRGRHAGISTIISTQKYMALNDNIRVLNVRYLTVFYGTNESDLEKISIDHPLPGLKPKPTLAVLKANLTRKYQSVTYDYCADADERLKDSDFKVINY